MSQIVDIRLYRRKKHFEKVLKENQELKKALIDVYKILKPFVQYRVAYDLIGNVMESREKVKRDVLYFKEKLKQIENVQTKEKEI